MEPDASDVAQIAEGIRKYQTLDRTYGLFLGVLYTYAERLNGQFFADTLPLPIIGLYVDGDRAGCYAAVDGLLLPHRIDLNTRIVANGWEAAEVLTHEMAHLSEQVTDDRTTNNYHGAHFHKLMYQMGIVTDTRFGNHVGKTAKWEEWKAVNADLFLEEFLLPGKGLTEQSD